MSYQFLVTVDTPNQKEHARQAILSAFAGRQPDGCSFKLADLRKRKDDAYRNGVADACKDFASLMARDAGKPTRIQLNPNGTWKPLA